MNSGARADIVRDSLKRVVVPALRLRGFRGSFPHFTRKLKSRIDLLNFQFSVYGPSLYVNIGQCGPDGVVLGNGIRYAPDKVRCQHTPLQRRLYVKGDSWDFENGEIRSVADSLSANMVELLDAQAEPWWTDAHGPIGVSSAS